MPQDSIVDWIDNENDLYNDKNGLFDRWVEMGDRWSSPLALEEAMAFARHVADYLEIAHGTGKYRKSDVRSAAHELLLQFHDYRDEAIESKVKEVQRKPKPQDFQMDPGDIEHAKKYEALAQELGIDFLRGYMPVGAERIRRALERGDKHLNTIPLRLWDEQARMLGRKVGSLSEGVSVLKHVAKWHFA